MGFFDFLLPQDINKGFEEYGQTQNAILVDVRTTEEYAAGHLPGSVNIPVDRIGEAWNRFADKDVPLFVYCRSGRRSRKAVNTLELLGFTCVKNIGGMEDYEGEVEG